MFTNRNFLLGVVAGIAVTYAYHHMVKPLPGPNIAARRGSGG